MKAPKRVLSDEISRAIGGRRVVAAMFTTFSFDPAFFELEILPLLFEGRIKGGFSHVEKVRRVQLEDCLRDMAEIEVFYDRSGLVGNAGPASLDFRRIDVGRRTGVFHPKLALVLVENPPSQGGEPTRSLIVATLSANLTRSGWWENLEAGHVEEIAAESPTNRRCTFREDLLDALGLIVAAAPPDDSRGALRTIHGFVQDNAPREGTSTASWGGRYYTRLFAGQKSLSEWLRDRRLGNHNWNLEVVSPFFDAHGSQTLRNLIRVARASEVRVFLPTEADGTPTVTQEQYDEVATVARWSRLPAGITRSAATRSSEGAAPRRVHAKVYRFWRPGKADITLVGSVNLTSAAHSPANAGNLEAAFLANTTHHSDGGEWWLQPLDDHPERFAELSGEEGDAERVGLALSLRYNWERHTFEYRLDQNHDGEIHLQTIAGVQLHTIAQAVEGDWRNCGTEVADEVKDLLVSTSFVQARIRTSSGQCKWRILVREEGMTHKPSLLAQLTPEEILQYWSLLSEAQRQAFIADRLETDEALLGGFGTPRPRSSLGSIRTVFDRFSGVFHAFERLSSWVDDKLERDRETEVTARLFGEKYDSLPVLLRMVLEREDQDGVIAYVTFLSAKQVVARIQDKWPSYWAEQRHAGLKLERTLEELARIRADLPLIDADREEFLTWYEDLFVMEATALEAEDDQDG